VSRRIAVDGRPRSRFLDPAAATGAGDLGSDWHEHADPGFDQLDVWATERLRVWGIGILAAVAAIGVGYLTAANPRATPPAVAVSWRISLVAVLVGAGLYARTIRAQARMGALLIAVGFFCCVWLLNGAQDRLAFSVGMLVSGLAPVAFCGLMVVHPTGRPRSSKDARFLALVGGALALVWLAMVATSMQPPLRTPLLRCAPHCPGNAFFVASIADGVSDALIYVEVVLWAVLAVGTAVLVVRRERSAPAPLRRSVSPVKWAAIAYMLFLAGFIAVAAVKSPARNGVGDATVEITILLPLAVLLGLGLERLFMGQALAEFVTQLSQRPSEDPQALMTVALRDPSVQIGYHRGGLGTVVDASGAPVATDDLGPGRAIAWIERDGRRVAAVIYDSQLCDQERFVQAAGAAALMRLERARLEADLQASTADLAASRMRLVETAYAERQRIERDLHDSVQQDLVGLRLKLDLAAEALKEEPARGERMIASVGREMDDVLDALRSLARGIYPSVLDQHGLGEALKSAARRSPLPVSVDARGLGRFSDDVEIAVYFCCLEALQNAVKHAGRGAAVTIRFARDPGRLRFAVSDTGGGFDRGEIPLQHGLVNMRDRIEAVGGTLTVSSGKGRGTSVRGTVPIA
jgi:signal transduction histidine kinase